jgi:hypothetical protein
LALKTWKPPEIFGNNGPPRTHTPNALYRARFRIMWAELSESLRQIMLAQQKELAEIAAFKATLAVISAVTNLVLLTQ